MKHHIFSDNSKGLRFVAIGGGNGLATLLSGLKKYVRAGGTEPIWIEDLSAVVAVTDDGGSSGRLRDELQMLPPGDIRKCMVALSEDSQTLSRLVKHRFRGDGDLGGHVFGNIFLAALSEITGDFAEAVKLSSEILASKGHIYPATVSDVRLGAELTDGRVVRGETKIGHVGAMIKRLFLEPADCKPMPEVLSAIEKADAITIGPGSLFTSLVPPVLVDGLAAAIARSKAVKIFICNLMTQPGETDGLSAHDHIDVFQRYAPEIEFDFVVVNDQPISEDQLRKYTGEGAQQIGVHASVSPTAVQSAEIVYGNLLDDGEKVRHSNDRLAQVAMLCALQTRKGSLKSLHSSAN